MDKSTKATTTVICIALINIFIHLLVYDNLEYHRDELLYFSLGLHPAFGYVSVPPLIGWIAYLIQSTIGFSLLAVKLLPALMSGVLVYLSSLISKELGGNSFAQVLTSIVIVIMPATLRVFHLFQPVFLDLMFWTTLLYWVIKYIKSENNKYLLLIGAISGIGMMNKYLIALLVLGLIVSGTFSKYRQLYKEKYFYYGLGLGLMFFIPNLMWQISHDLPVINHMQELNAKQLVNVSRSAFIIDQFVFTGAGSILMVMGYILLLRKSQYRMLGITALIVILILLLLRGKSYYSMGLIPMLIAAGAVEIELRVTNVYKRASLILLLTLITIPIIPFGLPVFKANGLVNYFNLLEKKYGLNLGRQFEDGSIHTLPQDYADQIGWEELTKITASVYNRLDKSKTIIYCENYGQAGAIATIGRKYGLPEPISFSESFIYWVPLEFPFEMKHLIYINDELGEDVQQLFDKISIAGKITNKDAREYGTTVYLLEEPNNNFNTFWNERLAMLKE